MGAHAGVMWDVIIAFCDARATTGLQTHLERAMHELPLHDGGSWRLLAAYGGWLRISSLFKLAINPTVKKNSDRAIKAPSSGTSTFNGVLKYTCGNRPHQHIVEAWITKYCR